VAQTLNTGGTPRTLASSAAVDWRTGNGWYLNLPVGERMTVDPSLQLGTFVIASNIPESNYCAAGGSSWLYALNYRTGGPVSTATSGLVAAAMPQAGQQTVGTFIGNALTMDVSLLQLPGGKVIALVSKSDTTVDTKPVDVETGGTLPVRRTGWRELN
jgi:type IV pilus assembly protein PilY1